MVRCCTCGPSNGGTCTNCVCVSSGVPCSGCPNLKLGKCKNSHAPSQGPRAPVLARKKGRVLGRPAPAATNLPDPPPPLRFGPLRLGPPEPSPAELARASEEGAPLLMFLFFSLPRPLFLRLVCLLPPLPPLPFLLILLPFFPW